MEHVFDYTPRPKPNQPFQIALEIKTGKENLYIISVAPAGFILFDQHTTTGRVIHKNEVRVCFHSRDGFHATGIFQIKIEQLDDPTIFFEETIFVAEPEAEKPVEKESKLEPITKKPIETKTESATSDQDPVKETKPDPKPAPEKPIETKGESKTSSNSVPTVSSGFFSKDTIRSILLIAIGFILAYSMIKYFEKPNTAQESSRQVKPQTITPESPKVLPLKHDPDATSTGMDTQEAQTESDTNASPEPEETRPAPTPVQPQAENPPKCGACP